MKKSKSKPENKARDLTEFCYWDGDTLVLNVLGTPGAKQNAIGKVKGRQLKISVTAIAEDGKATEHMIKFLAREFGVNAKNFAVVYGQFNINKQLRIKAPTKLPAVISEYLAKCKETADS
ncbi:MAG: DUF167 domain-containing protein [Methylomonas sp.]